MIYKIIISAFIILSAYEPLFSQVDIKFEIKGLLKNSKVLLSWESGEYFHIVDSCWVQENGVLEFKRQDLFDQGMYSLRYTLSNNNSPILEAFILDDDQVFTMKGTANEIVETSEFVGSNENTIFLEYQKKLMSLKKLEGIEKLNEKFKENYAAFKKKYSSSFTFKMLSFTERPEIPSTINNNIDRYHYYKNHYFDKIDPTFEPIAKSPFLHDFIVEYFDNLTEQTPDSIIKACDFFLSKFEANKAVFRYTLSYLLNKYSESRTICFDAIYVHLVQKYYALGKAQWMYESNESQELLKQMIAYAKKLEYSLCGKTAYNFKFTNNSGSNIYLSDINSTYTVIIFWSIDKSETFLNEIDILNKKSDILTKFGVSTIEYCVTTDEQIKSTILSRLTFDQLIKTKNTDIKTIESIKDSYNLGVKPKIYVLDKDKKILLKGISAESLVNYFEGL